LRRKPKDEARRARNELYRQHILEAAERVFAERGFENAKVQEISELAGLSMGTIYTIFSSKEELFRALLEERGRELLELAKRIVAEPGSARSALSALIAGYITYFVEHPTFLQMHLSLGTSWVVKPGPETDTQVQIWREIHGYQSDIFRRGITEGEFIDEDPAYLAKMFSAMDQVVLSDWAANGMKADRAALVARLEAMVERAFARGESHRSASLSPLERRPA
jgi:AcrR family transcriptional regulator